MGINPVWVTLVTATLGGLLAGLLTLVGVMITQRYTDRREKDRFDAEFKREQARWDHEDAVRSDERKQQRLADSYLEVLRLVEREGQWVDAQITNWRLAVEEAEANPPYVQAIFHRPAFEFERVKVPEPAVTDQAIIAANLVAFGSPNVERLYHVWRSTVTEIDEGRVMMIYGLVADEEGHQPGLGEVKELLDVLQPKQSAARQALAEAIANELGHRKPGVGDHPSDVG